MYVAVLYSIHYRNTTTKEEPAQSDSSVARLPLYTSQGTFNIYSTYN